MSRASIPTLLTLQDYARIIGCGPLHFNQAVSSVRPQRECSQIWYQYDWQGGERASREYLAQLINEAESDIAWELGYWPAPVWIEEERKLYPKPRRLDLVSYWGLDARGERKSVQLDWGHVLAGGVRATTLLSANVSYVLDDVDGDGFPEWATFTFTVPVGTDPCEVKAYFVVGDRSDPGSTGADPRWEVRPIIASCVGTTLTARIRSWELFRPDLAEALNAGMDSDDPDHPPYISADDLTNYVDALDFHREYTDTEHQVVFGWGDTTCDTPACVYTTQDGCIRSRNARLGIVIPTPGAYDATTGQYATADWVECVDPDLVWINYRSGWLPSRTRVNTCNELDEYWARTIAMLATARLDRPLCDCTNVQLRTDKWRQDMAEVRSEAGTSKSYQISVDVLTNPFGTRVGEVEAWRRVKKKRLGGAVKQ